MKIKSIASGVFLLLMAFSINAQVLDKKSSERESKNAISDISKNITSAGGTLKKGASLGNNIPSLSAKYCTSDGFDDLVPSAWEPGATAIDWTIATYVSGDPLFGVNRVGDWAEIVGTGTSTVLRFYPDRVDAKYCNGEDIYFYYIQRLFPGGPATGVSTFDFTKVFSTPTDENFYAQGPPKAQYVEICPSGSASLQVENGSDIFSYTLKLNGISVPPSITGAPGLPVDFPAVSGNGIYAVEVVNKFEGSCKLVLTDNVEIVVNPSPIATISGTTTVCLNDASPLVTFTGSGATAPYTFTYNINGGTPQTVTTTSGNSVTVSAPTGTAGTYNYNLTGVSESSGTTCSSIISDVATITVNALPTATISGSTTTCKDDAAPLLTFTGSGGTAPYTFTYNINGGAALTVVTTGGSSTVTVASSTAALGTYTYNLVGVQEGSANACSNVASGSAAILVNPYPGAAGPISGPAQVCQDQLLVGYSVPAITDAVSYLWNYTGTGATISGTGTSVTVNFSSTATSGNLTVVGVNPCGNGAPSLPLAITVNSVPNAVISGTTSVCQNGVSPSITMTGSNGIAPYTFTYNINGGTPLTAVSVGNVATVSAPTNITGTFTYNLLSVRDNSVPGCSRNVSGSAVVTVNTLPTATVTGGTSVCHNYASPNVTFTGANGTAPYVFTYTVNGGGNQTVTTVSGNSVTLPVPTNVVGSFTYTLVNVQDFNCNNAAFGNTIFTVKTLPSAIIAGATTVCQNAASPLITFTGSNGSVPYTFTYNVNGGANQTVSTSGGSSSVTVSVPTTTPGTFIYNLTGVSEGSGTACANTTLSGTATVVVKALPTATISGTTAVCKDDSAPLITFTGSGGTAPYTFTYTINGGAPLTAVTAIASNSVTVSANTSTAGTFVYTLTGVQEGSGSTCSNTASGSASVTVNPYPGAAGIISGSAQVCQDQLSVGYSVPVIANALSYQWNYTGTGATISGTGNSVTISFSTTATSGNLTVLGVNACGNGTISSPLAITVNSVPNAVIAGGTSVCQNAASPSITMTGSNGIAPYTFTYTINGGSTLTAVSVGNVATISVPTTSTGTFTYNLVSVKDNSVAGCSRSVSANAIVIVNTLPSATISGGTSVCHNTASPNVTFTGATGTAPYTFTYTVNGGGNQTVTTVSGNSVSVPVPTNVVGAFTYALVSVQDINCNNTVAGNTIFNVTPLPDAAGPIVGDVDVCLGESGLVYTIPLVNNAISYSWSYSGTGATIVGSTNSVTISFSNTATSGKLTVAGSNGCGNGISSNIDITVHNLPVPTITGSNSVCAGTTGVVYTTESGMFNYNWSISTGGIITAGLNTNAITVTWNTAGNRSVSVTYEDGFGCPALLATSHAVTVNQIDVTLSVNPPANPASTKVCVGQTVTYQANVTGGSTNYSYVFEQRQLPAGAWGIVYTGPSNIYTTANNLVAGNYEIRVNVTDNVLTCTDNVTSSSFEVVALPVVSLVPSTTSVCVNQPVDFTAAPSGFANYTFNIDNGATIINNGVNNVYSTSSLAVGNHLVYVTVASGTCSASSNPAVSVDVHALPIIGLSSDKPLGIACENDEVTFTATGGDTYQFYVDGNPSGIVTNNPIFKHTSTTDFVVSVAGFNTFNCEGAVRPTSSITISKPVATLLPLNPAICQGDALTFNVTGGVSYTFELNNASPVTQASPVYGPFGTYVNGDIVSVVATDTYGCQSPEVSSTVTVNPIPTVTLVSDKVGDAVCSGSPITFTATSTANNFEFFVNNVSVQGPSAVNTFTSLTLVNGDEVKVKATVSSTSCYIESTDINVTVNALPVVNINVAPSTTIIEGTSVIFTATNIGGATYTWTVNGNPVGINSNVYASSTLVEGDVVAVKVVDVNGCETNASQTMSVFDTVQPLTVSVSPSGYCTDSPTGVAFTITTPQTGVVYELYRETGDVLIAVGTNVGGVVSWTNIKNIAVGTENYYVIGYHPSLPAVRVEMLNRPQVIEYALPAKFAVSPTGTVTDCNGGAGYVISLDGSQNNVTYTLLRDNAPYGASVAGNGGPISFPATKTGGTYTVIASLDVINTCDELMTGTFVIDLSGLGIQYSLLSNPASGEYCEGMAGVVLSLNGSQNGIDYVLVRDGVTEVTTVTGTGSAISFGNQTAGVYTAEVRSGGCSLAMLNPVTVIEVPLSTKFDLLVDNNGFYCSGSTGVEISIAGQQAGVKYTLLREGFPVTTVVGQFDNPSLPLSLGFYNVEGNYTAIGVSGTPNCTSSMNNSVTLVAEELPQSVIFTSNATAYCQGSTIDLTIENSRAGTDYYLLLDDAETGVFVSGIDGAVSFTVSQPGKYGLRAVVANANTLCDVILPSTLTITETAQPDQKNIVLVAGTGTACDNGAVIRVESSQLGVQYTLYRDGIATSQVVVGTGGDVDFLPVVEKAANYTVMAQSNPGSCDLLMSSAPINVAIPGIVTSYNLTITPPTKLCEDITTGYVIGLVGSETGVEYTLFSGASNVQMVVGDGNAISFNAVFNVGTYGVRAVNPADATCAVVMPNTVDVAYHPTPVPSLSSDLGTTIINGNSVTFTAGGGISYEFAVNGAIVQPDSFDETFGPISTINNNDVVTVRVTDINGCDASKGLTMTVLGDITPLTVTTSAPGYCTTSANGVDVILSNPQAGITYELIRVDDAQSLGTGALVGAENIWTNIKNSGIGDQSYKVEAYYASVPAARVEMANRVTITEYALPIAFDLTPNQVVTDCAAPAGHTISLSGSEIGVEYRLYLNGIYTGNNQVGTGGAIAFYNVLSIGVHTIKASIPAANGCEVTMNGALDVQIAGGVVHNLVADRADGQFCAGSTGVAFSLDNSENGVSYTLMQGSVVKATVVSTGGALALGSFATEGTYMVYADLSGCQLPMNGSVTTTEVDLPTPYVLSAENNGEYCATDIDGVELLLQGQQPGYSYELYRDGVLDTTVVSTHSTTATWLSFGQFTEVGNYTVQALVPVLGCSNGMSGSVDVAVQSLPAPFAFITDNNVYCQGGSTVLYIPNSVVGTDYQLLRNGVTVGSPLPGNGSQIDFIVSQVGDYKISSKSNHSSVSCDFVMDDANAIAVTESILPEVRTVNVVDGTDCDNGTVITVVATQAGIDYLVTTLAGAPVPGYIITGDGSDLSFNELVDNGGVYRVIARNANGCETELQTNINVNIAGAIAKQTVTIPSSICLGDVGVQIGLADSEVGVEYTLYDATTAKETIIGDGDDMLFAKVFNEGEYYVLAQNATAPTCPNEMLNRVMVKYNPLPKAYSLTGSGYYCGSIAAEIGVEASEWKVKYTLMLHTTTGKQFIETIDGSFTEDSIFFSGITTEGTYSVFAMSEFSCPSSMKDSVIVKQMTIPTAFTVDVPTLEYCASEGGSEVYLSGMEKGVTYLIENTDTDEITSVIGTVDAATPTLLTELEEGTYNFVATWGGDACEVSLNSTPILINVAPVAAATPNVVVDDNVVCSGAVNMVRVTNAVPSTVYDLVVDGLVQNLAINSDTATIEWDFAGTVGLTQVIGVKAYIDGFIDCAVSSNVEYIDTKLSPSIFNVLPADTTYYCLGENGIQIELSGCEPDVFYELMNEFTGERVDYYLPSPAEAAAGSAFKFRIPQFEDNYTVQARFLTGGCISQMMDTAVVREDTTGTCIPLIAIDDMISMGKSDVTVNDSIYLNDKYNSLIDTIGFNLEFTLITNWVYEPTNTSFETIGEASLDQNGVLIYTKLPGFYGRDSVKYVVQNKNVPSRVDTAIVFIMVGNHSIEDGSLLIPNLISPNGDAYNQTFVISGLIEEKLVDVNDDRVKSSLEIYNRWGTLVYRSKGEKYMNDWDGTNNGSMVSIGDKLPSGTYYYVFNITFSLTDKIVNKTYNGFVELVR